ncbi:MAG TPA: winged helix DNA-binding domain-containing protein [Candidatus Limnocylindrales bacterium]|nr:winged helix DNA-binding domain-containing protein [Candidatus Limnocylindrales bacterium]
MRLTARQLNRATLARQMLLRRERAGVVEAFRRVAAVQAQEPASPYIALWNRVQGFDATELDRAFAEYAIVKATLMRITLHAVDAADYPAFHEAMQPTLRAARMNDRRFTRTGLTKADADALVPAVLEFASKPRTNAEAEGWLDARLGVTPKPGVWWALRQAGPLVHAPTGGPWSFRPRPSYIAAPRQERSGDITTAQGHLVRRYLEGFGPASVHDIAQFGLVGRSMLRDAVQSLGDTLVRLEGPDGKELLDVPDGTIPSEDSPASPRLLPMWDSVLLAYADRSRIVPAEYRRVVARSNGDTLPAVLVDGYVAGVWRPADRGIELTAFLALDDDAWADLDAEARALVALLADREPAVYRRYARWWGDLPQAAVRIVGG